jgi:predicted dehydrogenase
MTTRWGFIATGRIASLVARDLALLPDGERFAVGSRDQGRADAFAAEHGFARAYGSYEALLADDDVDVVYVATPHAQHHLVTSRALAAGKPVLVEKAFTVSLAAAEDLVQRAKAERLFCMEAMWTRHLPVIMGLRHLVADGAIGEVRSVQAELGFRREFNAADRLWAPELGGGALLDIGVYPVSFAHMLLGTPASVAVAGVLGPNGVDADAGLLLGYPDGVHARLGCTLTSHVAGGAIVTGTTGRIELVPPFHHPPRLVLHRPGREPEVLAHPPIGRGYAHQLMEVQRCLEAGLVESPVMPLQDTVEVMAILETALDALGAVHVDEGFPH